MKKDRSLIFIKATTIALGIVLVVLMALLFILKIKQKDSPTKCPELNIEIANELEEFENSETQIIILTKPNKQGKQEVITIQNRHCPKIISRFTIENRK